MTQVRYLLKDPTSCQLQIESDAAAKDDSSYILVLVPVGVGVAGVGPGLYGGSLTEVGIAALIYTLVVGAAVIEALYKVWGCTESDLIRSDGSCASIFARIATQGLVQRWGSGDGSRMVATSAEILALASTIIAEPCRQPDKAR